MRSDYWHLSFPLVNLCLLIRTPLALCYQPIYGIGLQVFFCLVLINWLECAYQCIWLTIKMTISSNVGVTLLSACSSFLTMVNFGQTYPSKPNMSKKIWKKYSPISPRVLISPILTTNRNILHRQCIDQSIIAISKVFSLGLLLFLLLQKGYYSL